MATIQDVFSHIYTTEAHLSEVPIKNGQIILCVDSEKLYIDHGTTRVGTSDVVQVASQETLPLAPLDKFYSTQDTGDVYFYTNGEWKKLTDTINDYTAFEVYANNSVIAPGDHEVLGTVTVEIPVQMTETFALRTTTAEADSDVVVDWGDGIIQKVKDGEHGGYTGPDSEGRYIAKMTHTYSTSGKYTVKVYGHDYFCLSHAPSHAPDASNMQCRILADDLPIASHLTNLTAFAYGTLKLVTVQCASYKYLHRTTNHAQMFTNDKNLLSVTGFKDMVMLSRGAEGCFQFCENMHTCDFNGVLCSNNPRAMYAMFQNCYALAVNIGTFFPTKFVSRALNFTNTFTHCRVMTGTVPAKQLWGDPTIDWQGYNNCFYGCPEAIRSQVPTAWGGTSTSPVAYELSVDSITLKEHAANTANGLVILNTQGKVDTALLPDTSIDLGNYSQNGSINLTSQAGAVNLTSMTMDVGLYSGPAYVKANINAVELTGANLKFNDHVQNTAGGIVVVDAETGLIPESLLPSGDIDLSNYITTGNISMKASGSIALISNNGNDVKLGSGTANIIINDTNVSIGGDTMAIRGENSLQLVSGNSPLKFEANDLLFNSSSSNTAGGLVILNEQGKIDPALYDTTVDLSNYTTTAGIRLTTSQNTVYISGPSVTINGGSTIIGDTAGTTKIQGSGVTIEGILNIVPTDISPININGASVNTANGLVQLNTSGKIPANLYDVTIDLTNYSIAEEIHLTSNQKLVFAGLGCSIECGNDSIILQGGTSTVTTIGTEKLYVTGATEFQSGVIFDNSIIVSDNNGLHELNQAYGLVQLDGNGKIPASLYDAGSTVDLGNYNGNVALTASGDNQSVSLKYDATSTSGSSYTSSLLLDDGKIDIDANAGNINMMAHTVMVGTLQRTLQAAMINASDLQINVTNLLFNNHPTNTANGFAIVGENGKLPSSILPEMSQSWTKVTLNQADFATTDATYGGSYKELNGICSVEVYDADGYKVEFDVKCDFTNNKTRIYIPSGLTASTISNWTLLYLAKTIA